MDIIYFELNNWIPGEDYPDEKPFSDWMRNDFNLSFANPKFVKENKLCVCVAIIDMSVSFLITATKDWVLNNCPKLLSDYKQFLSDGSESRYGYGYFLPYEERYIGTIETDNSYWKEYENI